jgi:hypothetical protein
LFQFFTTVNARLETMIVDDEGRTFFAPLEWSSVPDVNAGDRVEFEAIGPSTAGTRLSSHLWVAAAA